MKTVKKLWAINTALSIHLKIQKYDYSYANMTKCYLLLVVCRSWNHNIDTGLLYYKSLNVNYSLSTDTWICIYLIVLAALTNKINTFFYLHCCIQYAILIVFLFFLIWQQIHMHNPMSERPLYF